MTFIGGKIQHIPGSQGAVNALGLPGIKNSREMKSLDILREALGL